MTDSNRDDQRASLRGKGREILLGQQAQPDPKPAPEPPPASAEPPDPAALSLTPDEADALLDFDPDAAVYGADVKLPDAPVFDEQPPPPMATAADLLEMPPDWVDEAAAEADLPEMAEPPADWLDAPAADFSEMAEPPAEWLDAPLESQPVDAIEDPALAETTPDWLDAPAEPPLDADTASYVEDDVPVREDWTPWLDVTRNLSYSEAIPLSEREEAGAAQDESVVAYAPLPYDEPLVEDVAAWQEVASFDLPGVEPAVVQHEGGQGEIEEVSESSAASVISDPFESALQRTPADQLFRETPTPDEVLLTRLVNDERMDRLWAQIEALHEELVQEVEGDRQRTDAHQQELLQASALLLQSRANYDDARAIVYRIRADLNRQRKVSADVVRYRPLLLNYYLGWGIAVVVLFLLRELFAGVTEAVGVEVFAELYYPFLLGVVGALISGFITLERHTTRLRDFDPVHISWYLFNPLLGAVMGLLMFLLASIANEDLLEGSASRAEISITYLLCVVAGMNQNHVLRQLNDLLKQFGRGGKS